MTEEEIIAKLEGHPAGRRFLQQMPAVDDLTLIVLKGHLLIEEILERIVRTVVAHGELVPERFSFAHKAGLGRAMCWTKHDDAVWAIIEAVNSLRNELAHQLESPKVDAKLAYVLGLFEAEPGVAAMQGLEYLPAESKLRVCVIYCMSFLSRFEEDAQEYRRIVDTLREVMASGRESSAQKG